MKFIHVADIHLGMRPDQGFPWAGERIRDVADAFDQLLSEVIHRKVDLLLIAGDFFHRLPTVRELKEIDYKLSKLAPTRVVIIAGNHDHIKEGHPYEKHQFASNVTILKDHQLESVSFADLATTVSGFSYYSNEIKEPRYDDLKADQDTENFQILLAHGGDEKHCPMNYDKLKWSGFDYIALGHIHKPQIIVEDFMAYPGSLIGLNVTETGERGYIYGEMTQEHQKITFIPMATKRYLDLLVTVTGSMTNGQINDLIEKNIQATGVQHFYHVALRGTKSYDFEVDLYDVQKQYHIFKISDQLEEDYDIDLLAKENENNLLGSYIQKLNRIDASDMERQALHYGVKALLRAKEKAL